MSSSRLAVDHECLPYNLSLQFSIPPVIEANLVVKKTSKTRNKKVKEKQEYDILQVDEQIRTCFIQENNKIPEYHKRIVSMTKHISSIPVPFGIDDSILADIKSLIKQFPHESKSSSCDPPPTTYQKFLEFYSQLKKLSIKIDNVSSGELYKRYETLTAPILEEYKYILSIPIKTVFVAKLKPRGDDKKIELRDRYLRVASNFIDIDYVQEEVKARDKYVCCCGNNADFEIREGTMTCENCGMETSIISIQTTYRDQERINLHHKYRYEKRSHFKEGVYQFQGKQNKYVDPSLYIKADEWLIIHNMLDLSVDSEDKRARYIKVKKEHIRLFLSESHDRDLTGHYEDINLIYSTLTGVPCPDISYLEEKLYAQFDKLVEAFFSIGDDIERTNILNSAFVLKKLLLMNKYPVDPQDFPGLKTVSRQQDHETLFFLLCQKSGLNHPDTTTGIMDIPKTNHDGFF